MATSEVLVKRIYSVKVQGINDSVKQAASLTTAFNKMDAAKKKLDEQLAKKMAAGDTKAVEELTKKIADLQKQIDTLGRKKEASAKESLLMAKADTEAAKATAIRTKSIIDQDKELDRQIANEEKRNKRRADSARAVGNNYYALLDAEKKAIEAYKLFDSSTGDTSGLEKVKKAALEATARVKDFNRTLSPDGTLVGEYKTGILNAFKNLGLTDIIKKQRDDITNQLNGIKQQTQSLAKQYQDLSTQGGKAFDNIGRELQENIELQQRLENQLLNINTTLNNTGSIGKQITTSIKDGFNGLFKQAVQFTLGYIGFQKVISEVQQSIGDARQIEGIEAAFRNLNRPGLLDNLRAATRGTVSDLELMQRAVQANNFQIPLEQLASLLDFARRRAKDSGQEVNYLVDSIVTGIGRKSPLILDNLGISAVRLREKLKGLSEENQSVGDVAQAVAQIVAEENAKAGREIDTYTEKIASNEAMWKNLRTELGQRLLPIITLVGTIFSGLVATLGIIPWPVLAVGIALVTTAITNQYIATSIATKQGLIYATYLALQDLRTKAVAISTRLATYQITLFNGAIKISPLGIFLTILGLLVPTVLLLAKSTKEAALGQKALNDVNRESNRIYAEQTNELNRYYSVATNSNVTLTTRQSAIQKLIDQFPDYFGNLKKETASLTDLEKGYNKLTEAIRFNARVQASAKLSAERQASANQAAALTATLETQFTADRNRRGDFGSSRLDVTNLSAEDKELLDSALKGVKATSSGDIEIFGVVYNYKEVVSNLEKVRRQRQDIADRYNILAETYDKENKEKQKAAQLAAQQAFIGRLNNRDVTETEVQKLIDDTDKELKSLKLNDPKRKQLIEEIKKYQQILDDARPKDPKDNRGSRLTGIQRDTLKDIDANRDEDLATQELLRAQGIVSEEAYYRNIFEITRKYTNQKLSFLKGTNAEERRQEADLKLSLINAERDTNRQIFELKSKQYQDELALAKTNAEQENNAIIDNPASTETQRVNAKIAADQQMLLAQQQYNQNISRLEREYVQRSKESEQERKNVVLDLERALREDKKKILQASVTDIQTEGDNAVAKLKNTFSKQREVILESNKSQVEKSTLLLSVDKLEEQSILAQEIATLKKLLPIYKTQVDSKEITEKQYAEFYEAYVAKLNSLQDSLIGKMDKAADAAGIFRNKLAILLKFDLTTEKGRDNYTLLGETISSTFSIAQNAMNNYFDSEQQRIEQSKNLLLKRIDIEKEAALATADSQAERDAIEKKAAAEREKAEREAFEKNKKLQIAQAKINLATQLSNLAVIAFAPNPLNIATLGAAGAIMYGIQAGLALVNFGLNVARINAAQYAKGGKVAPIKNGKITSPANIQPQPNGDNVIATVKTGEVVLNEEQQRKLGGARTFAAIGVPGFAAGGLVGYGYPGTQGENLKPPVNPSSFLNPNSSSSAQITDIYRAIDQQTANINTLARQTNERIDKVKVQVVAREVVTTDSNFKKASAVGTI